MDTDRRRIRVRTSKRVWGRRRARPWSTLRSRRVTVRCDLVAFAGTREHRWEAHDGVSFPTGSRRVMKRTRGALPTQIRQGALGTGSKQARWAREVMTDEDRTWVDEVLGRAVVRMGGMVTEENVGRLLKLTTMADRFQGE